uniref:Uncharacterized protein n=1 Tax=Oryza meridionalis TaxID=40149 RepID=A0A0E0DBI9_9ORYZ
MSFAAVGTRIVGVGLDQTTVYDPKTSTVRAGCRLVFPKVNPVLVSHGGKLYALSRCPSVVDGRDFEPWFLVLDGLGYVGWRQLPPPPIFPWRLNTLEYRDPPAVRVAAYAIVGSHILLSVQQQGQDKGTCAFDMDAEQWEMVLDTNLPFTGQAVPLGDHRFVACSMAKGGAASVYYMKVLVFPPGISGSGTGKKELSIVELQVESKHIVPGHLLCAMGKGSFSSFDFRSTASPAKQDIVARIVHRAYAQAEAEADDSADTDLVVMVKREDRQIYKLRDPHTNLVHPSWPVAALTILLRYEYMQEQKYEGQWENEGQDENIPPVPDLNGDHQASISSVTSASGGTDTAMFKSVGALVPIISASHEIPNITFKVLSQSFPLYIGLRRSPSFNPHRDGHKSMEVKIDPKLGIGKPRGQSVKKLKQMAYQFGVLFAEGPIAEEDFAPENQDQPDSVPADCVISSSEDWAANVWSYSPTPEEGSW